MAVLIFIGIIVLVVLLALWFFGTYNSLVHLKMKAEEAFSTIDVYLKKRYDLIPNFVETVKGYAAHEKETLAAVIEARNQAYSSKTISEKVESENNFSGALGRLMVLTEAYPDLKANANFIELQRELSSMEDELAQARKYYNAVIKQLNTKILSFPAMIVASFMGMSTQSFFEVTSAEERQNVKVDFSK